MPAAGSYYGMRDWKVDNCPAETPPKIGNEVAVNSVRAPFEAQATPSNPIKAL